MPALVWIKVPGAYTPGVTVGGSQIVVGTKVPRKKK